MLIYLFAEELESFYEENQFTVNKMRVEVFISICDFGRSLCNLLVRTILFYSYLNYLCYFSNFLIHKFNVPNPKPSLSFHLHHNPL